MAAADFIIVVLMLGIFTVLMTGVIIMGIGGKANKKYSNKLMSMRVALQGLVLVVLLLAYFMSSKP